MGGGSAGNQEARAKLKDAEQRQKYWSEQNRIATKAEEEFIQKRKFKGDRPHDLAAGGLMGTLAEGLQALLGGGKGGKGILEAFGRTAQPSFSAIEESYKKIQLSALANDPLTAEIQKVQMLLDNQTSEIVQAINRQTDATSRITPQIGRN
jgi:hypothetical protein